MHATFSKKLRTSDGDDAVFDGEVNKLDAVM